uniref:Protein E6-like n=1 Tax=Rhizophora mucronata TaxID=61149 RepID=A0A2P2P4Y6_RHIMU
MSRTQHSLQKKKINSQNFYQKPKATGFMVKSHVSFPPPFTNQKPPKTMNPIPSTQAETPTTTTTTTTNTTTMLTMSNKRNWAKQVSMKLPTPQRRTTTTNTTTVGPLGTATLENKA